VKLKTIMNVSVDGYVEDEHGSFDFTVPDDEVFAFITDLLRPVGTHLYGTAQARDDASLGDRLGRGRRIGAQSRLRERLASSGQSRLLHDHGGCVDGKDSARAHLRRRLGPRHEGRGHR
jgi:hypothetical protein